jgi:hypothetical protein
MIHVRLIIFLAVSTAIMFLLVVIYILGTARRVTLLFRRVVNPTFPVTGKEVYDAAGKIASPILKVSFLATILKSRLKIITAKHTGNAELDRLLTIGRALLITWIGIVLLDAIAILSLASL